MNRPFYDAYQNLPENIKLLQASSAAYKKAKSKEFIFTYVILLLAIIYPFSYVFSDNEDMKLILFGCSFLITVLTQILTTYFSGNTSKGALLKEEFDVRLFQIPWKFTLPKPDQAEISKLSLQYKGNPIKDWYSPNLLPSIPKSTAIGICQRINCGWDIELRTLYRNTLQIIMISYSMLLLIFIVVTGIDGKTIFSILFSILSFYTHFINLISGNTTAIKKRKAISQKLDEYVNNQKELSIQNLRDIQDEIYNTRKETAKVPDFFFRQYD